MTLSLADLGANLVDRALDERIHLPIVGDTGDLVQKVLEDRRPTCRVHDLGMELHAVDLALGVADRRDVAARRRSERFEARWQRRDGVAVRHPHARAAAGTPSKNAGRRVDRQHRRPELGVLERDELAAEISRDQLHAVANAEQSGRRFQESPDPYPARSSTSVLSGPPERMIAAGSRGEICAPRRVVGEDLAVDPSSRVRRAIS